MQCGGLLIMRVFAGIYAKCIAFRQYCMIVHYRQLKRDIYVAYFSNDPLIGGQFNSRRISRGEQK